MFFSPVPITQERSLGAGKWLIAIITHKPIFKTLIVSTSVIDKKC